MGALEGYLREVFKNIRADVKYDGIAIKTVTETGIDSDDVFGIPASTTTATRIISGAVAWGNTIQYQDAAGGQYKRADCTIVASLDEKASLDIENVYLVVSNVELRVTSISDAIDTNEMVIACERITK